jgi:hypothetical protein
MLKSDSESPADVPVTIAALVNGVSSTKPNWGIGRIHKELSDVYIRLNELLDESQMLKHEYAGDENDHVSVTLLEATDSLVCVLNNLTAILKYLEDDKLGVTNE